MEICVCEEVESEMGKFLFIFDVCTHTHTHAHAHIHTHTHTHSLDEFHLDTSSDNLTLDPPSHSPSVEDFGHSLLVG